MRTHTDAFKQNIKQLGRRIGNEISYTLNNTDETIDDNNINYISLHYQGGILQSIMKQLDIDVDNEIPVGTELNYKFKIKIRPEEIVEKLMVKAGTGFYENFYYPNIPIETLRRYITTGVKIDLENLLRASAYNNLTQEEKNYLTATCNKTQTKITIYPYEPLAVTDYTSVVTVVLKPEVISSPDEYSLPEYLDFGNYIVYSCEKQEDTNSYKIIAYDKMLYSMKDYEHMNITYPITVRNYINAIATHLGLTFKNINDTFANYNKEIPQELYIQYDADTQTYKSLGYTFRDVLDELSQVTASTICINEEDDELEVRYINETSDIIDEEFLKDTDVKFGEKYGPINSIVLSRSAGADNVYLRDEDSVTQNGLCEVKISDNQIMNGNNRSEYLSDILNKLDGLEYYTNDYQSTGICYYEPCDKYTIQIGNNYYTCIMFNDEINNEQGLEEIVYTELPEESVTDYSKADSTDRRISQTYLIVDKQNQEIEAVISQTTDPDNPDSTVNQITRLNARVGQLESEISEIADLTTSGETSFASLLLENINQSEPVTIKIHPTSDNISYLYPNTGLYPSSTLYIKTRTLLFTRTYEEDNVTKTEYIPYELPDDLLYYDETHYDEFLLDYSSQTCQVTKKCKWNADGSVGLLDSERIDTYEYPTINLDNGDYTISLYGYNYGYIFARLMVQNIYTDQFYTKYETDSKIEQTATDIEIGVNQTLTNYVTTSEMNSAINVKANEINSSVSSTYSTKAQTTQAKNEAISTANSNTDTKLQDYSTTTEMTNTITQKIEDNNTNYVNIEVAKKVDNEDFTGANIMLEINNDQSGAIINADKISLVGKTIDMTSDNIAIDSTNFKVTKAGHVTASSMDITGGSIDFTTNLGRIQVGKGTAGLIVMNATSNGSTYDTVYGVGGWNLKKNGNYIARLVVSTTNPYFRLCNDYGNEKIAMKVVNSEGTFIVNDANDSGSFEINGNYAELRNSSGNATIDLIGEYGYVDAYAFRNMSLAENKKDIELFENALDQIKNTNIYKYHFKNENSKDKKHLGFVIGDNYNYPESATIYDKNGNPSGADAYALASLCLQAIKEQQAIIEDLQNKIDKLERESEK